MKSHQKEDPRIIDLTKKLHTNQILIKLWDKAGEKLTTEEFAEIMNQFKAELENVLTDEWSKEEKAFYMKDYITKFRAKILSPFFHCWYEKIKLMESEKKNDAEEQTNLFRQALISDFPKGFLTKEDRIMLAGWFLAEFDFITPAVDKLTEKEASIKAALECKEDITKNIPFYIEVLLGVKYATKMLNQLFMDTFMINAETMLNKQIQQKQIIVEQGASDRHNFKIVGKEFKLRHLILPRLDTVEITFGQTVYTKEKVTFGNALTLFTFSGHSYERNAGASPEKYFSRDINGNEATPITPAQFEAEFAKLPWALQIVIGRRQSVKPQWTLKPFDPNNTPADQEVTVIYSGKGPK